MMGQDSTRRRRPPPPQGRLGRTSSYSLLLLLLQLFLSISTWNRCEAFAPLQVRMLASFPTATTTQLNVETKRERKRDRFLRQIGIKPSSSSSSSSSSPSSSSNPPPLRREITTQQELQEHWQDPQGLFRRKRRRGGSKTDYTALLRAASVKGDTQIIGSPQHKDYTHPVVQLIHERRRKRQDTIASNNNKDSNSTPHSYDDGAKVILAVEGGGMRGCVSAGMICALHHLNLTDTIDAVYGSSAGTIVGAYLITKQLPWFGPELYYDRLTTAGRNFIDTRRLLRAIGFGLLDPRLLKDVVTRQECGGKPVLNLHYLLKHTVQDTKPLDWETFVERQKVQPLNVIASGLRSERSVVLNMANGGFGSLEELTDCMHASCLLPGIAGPLMNVHKNVLQGKKVPESVPKMVLANNLANNDGVDDDHSDYEPLADALLYEPLPYRTAVEQDGATHCIVIRSRPDGVDVTGKGGIFERLIAYRFFRRKNRLPHMYQRLKMHLHKYLYAEDVIRLNEAAHSTRDFRDVRGEPHLMTMAAPPGSPEVTRLEVGREAIFEGIRRGFARAYDCLVEDPAERGKGMEVARRFFPDEILDYEPLEIDVTDQSAFEAYMKQQGISPASWEAEQIREEIMVLKEAEATAAAAAAAGNG